MHKIYVTDFNANISDITQMQYKKSLSINDLISEYANLGYLKLSVIFDEYDNKQDEFYHLNDKKGVLYKVDYSYFEKIKEYGKTKIKKRNSHIFVYAENADIVKNRIDILYLYACKNPLDLSIESICQTDFIDKNVACLAIK